MKQYKVYKVIKALGELKIGDIINGQLSKVIVGAYGCGGGGTGSGYSFKQTVSTNDKTIALLLLHCGFIEEVVEWKPENLKNR